MASVESTTERSLFDQIKSADPKEVEKRQQAVNERIHATFQRSQERLAGLIGENSTLPTTVSSVTVLGAPNTRHSFLKRIVDPLLSANRDLPYTQSELVQEVSKAATKLSRFGELAQLCVWFNSDMTRHISSTCIGIH
jgi:outer membrane protein insertion porin family